ncbi:pyrimidine-nucleoside phosphorylase [Gordoniibacillus kamchatkensis]|uniref:pyrimidine-nucleoside phosphorylase n=1 Tax=Gordoniibacillus kamchatkensis TaxID=1590651 RepID=UPI0009E53754
MRMVDVIQKKRDGGTLAKDEIEWIVRGYTQGDIPDYQMSAFLMAVYLVGMTDEETSQLTLAMAHSGEMLDLSGIHGVKVDKHSTGGVGDKTSLIVAPLVASVGVPVAKMSGRGLGHTGGTIDKLEAIPGFRVELTKEEFVRHVNDIKLALVGQSGNLAPADKKMYALRDVTATVSCIPLIASSIMSKKIAAGADAIVLDVKVGAGAFMKDLAHARQLAETMVRIGRSLGRRTIAVLSDMDQPLGTEIGNASEVREAIAVLNGGGPDDLRTVCLALASHMAVLGGVYPDFEAAHTGLQQALASGAALETFARFVAAQGGDPELVRRPELLPRAEREVPLPAASAGFIEAIDAEKVGLAAMLLGAGRLTKEDAIDYAVGVTLRKKVGDRVELGETLAVLHVNGAKEARRSPCCARRTGSGPFSRRLTRSFTKSYNR